MSRVGRVFLVLLLVSLFGGGVRECFGGTVSKGGKGNGARSNVLELSDGRKIKFVSLSKVGKKALRVVLPGGKVVVLPRSRLSEAERKRRFGSVTDLHYGKAVFQKSALSTKWFSDAFKAKMMPFVKEMRRGVFDARKAAWKRLVDDPKVTSVDQLFLPSDVSPVMEYYYFAPSKKELRGRGKVPLVVFLHGIGEAGGDKMNLFRHPQCLVFIHPKTRKRHPCYLLVPHLDGKSQTIHWLDENLGLVVGIVDEMLRKYPRIDPDRVYVTGLSSGGFASWDLLLNFPGKFAGAVPVSAGDKYMLDQIKVPQRVGVWCFLNTNENKEMREGAVALLRKSAEFGADCRYTTSQCEVERVDKKTGQKKRVRGPEHFAWLWAYAEPELIPWLFEHRRDKKAAAAAAAKKRKKEGGE